MRVLTGASAGVFVLVFGLLMLSTLLFGGWVLMLLVGALHHSVWAAIPALGYIPSTLIYTALAFVSGLFRNR